MLDQVAKGIIQCSWPRNIQEKLWKFQCKTRPKHAYQQSDKNLFFLHIEFINQTKI